MAFALPVAAPITTPHYRETHPADKAENLGSNHTQRRRSLP